MEHADGAQTPRSLRPLQAGSEPGSALVLRYARCRSRNEPLAGVSQCTESHRCWARKLEEPWGVACAAGGTDRVFGPWCAVCLSGGPWRREARGADFVRRIAAVG